MPRKTAGIVEPNAPVDEVEVDEVLVTTAPDDWEFETHTDQVPTHVEFENPGDSFVGQFTEVRHIVPDKGGDEFDLLIFKGRDNNPYSLTPGYKLEKAFIKGDPKPIEPGTWCRITLVQLVETNAKEPMKDFKVETRSK